MKNQNLKEAFRALDKETLGASTHAPAEELYYSSEYEKKMNRLLGKKNGKAPFAWKQLGKQAGAFALGAAVAAGIALAVPKADAKEENSIWQYDVVDFVDTSYTVHSPVTTLVAEENGYEKNTYEYDYLTILSEISFYTGVAENYMLRSKLEYAEGSYIGGFFEEVSKEEICAPYDDILLRAFEILDACGFAPAELSSEVMWDYYCSLPCEKDRAILMHCAGLSLANVHEKLTENAKRLLALDEKYPDYEGDFFVSAYVREKTEALIEACAPVYENKVKHTEKWIAYVDSVAPTLDITEEFIPGLDAMKITISGNGTYRVPALASRFIENYEYEMITNSQGMPQKNQRPTESITIYMPTYTYFGRHANDTELYIERYDGEGKVFVERYPLGNDLTQYYSDEPITMNNPSFDAILRGYFGGDYSERDLLSIQGVLMQYFEYEGYPSRPFEVWIDVWDGTRVRSLKCELDIADAESEEVFAEELAEDLGHFHGLAYFQTNGDADRFVSEELAKELNPYIVNPDDTH